MSRPPRAFRLDRPDVVTAAADEAERRSGAVVITDEPMNAIEAADGTPVPMPRRRAPWVGILLSALGGLVALALGLALEGLIAELFRIAPWLGWVGLGLAALAVVAFLAVVFREAAGILRERRIEHLRRAAFDALAVKDHEAAKTVVADLAGLYRERRGPGRRPPPHGRARRRDHRCRRPPRHRRARVPGCRSTGRRSASSRKRPSRSRWSRR